MQATLDGQTPTVYRLRDKSPLRYTDMCVYYSHDIELKKFNEPRNYPSQYHKESGRCQTKPRYVLDYDDTKFLLCWKHVPTELKENNFGGTYGEK